MTMMIVETEATPKVRNDFWPKPNIYRDFWLE